MYCRWSVAARDLLPPHLRGVLPEAAPNLPKCRKENGHAPIQALAELAHENALSIRVYSPPS